ncbi:protein-tyrosine-phosphatase [Frankia sp. AiPs1]|uniref:arsenate reductase/protein-tyrosine-phosphatase family protein n=1 Tax=Frankia sp. AiPs1 TaxID=573493 RepID=UPI002043902A|nr:protein-tyrosine-phosphatase [Frankia sp. AiPs1]MCM3925165.1 protein-tyrosine-phosphatase [Frankia sp. AiPs1]
MSTTGWPRHATQSVEPGGPGRAAEAGGPGEQRWPWTVLMVCTGNLCRSPLAEHLAAARFRAAPDPAPVFHSAGVYAEPGTPMHPHAAALLRARGVDPAAFRTRPLTAELIGASDLVLCATRRHRSAVVALAPRALRRTFTVCEFGRLTSGVRPADLPAGPPRLVGECLTAAAWRARASGRIVAASLDDLTDPLGGGRDAFATCARLIDEALSNPLALLAGACRAQPVGWAPAAR